MLGSFLPSPGLDLSYPGCWASQYMVLSWGALGSIVVVHSSNIYAFKKQTRLKRNHGEWFSPFQVFFFFK